MRSSNRKNKKNAVIRAAARGGSAMVSQCEKCQYYAYDEDYEAYMCEMNMDEDEYARLVSGHRQSCPYYKRGDEYFIVRKQM